jgi:hypothetical protein
VLAVFDGDLIRRITPTDNPRRFTRSIQQMATKLLRVPARAWGCGFNGVSGLTYQALCLVRRVP